MSEPEDRDSGTQPPPPPQKDEPWLSSRLRDKFDDMEDDFNPGKKPPAVVWIVGLVVVVVAIAAGWWFMHDRQVKARLEAERVQAAAIADSIAKVRLADSLVAVARADSIAAFNQLPLWKQRQVIAKQKGLPVEEGPFALEAGEFLFEERANTEAAALKASTGLATRVKRVGEGAYRIYLGRFDDPDQARKTAASLAAKGVLAEARVVPLR